jgi:hypothetical protein
VVQAARLVDSQAQASRLHHEKKVLVNTSFPCPACSAPLRIELPAPPTPPCPACGQVVALTAADPGPGLERCAVCGTHELYKKKDFPHGLGMTILVLAFVASTVTYYLYATWWTWAILLGSALFDGLLYLWVGDVVVCYRCDAHYRAVPPSPRFQPFELGVFEKYRQERIRLQQLQEKN